MKLSYDESSNTFSDEYTGGGYHMYPKKTDWDLPANKLTLGIMAILAIPLLLILSIFMPSVRQDIRDMFK